MTRGDDEGRLKRDAPGSGAAGPGSSPPSQSARLRPRLGPGARLGPLTLLAQLGSGASGSVYRARHEELGRLCAVKVLHGTSQDDRVRRRFERETEALGRLSHPGIVRVYAVHHLEGVLACEMQLVEGETLEALLERQGPLPWRDAARLVADLADAVQHAHEAGVLHRDLKPENVLMRAEDGRPLVADLGLTRLTDRSSSLTVAGAMVGSPFYMAPEAFEGRSEAAADVYGLGAILYAALTGRQPFEAASLPALMDAVTSGRCEATAAAGAPSALEEVRAHAMAVDPTQRHASPRALAEDLEAVLAGRSPRPWIRRTRPRRRLAAGLVAVGLVVAGLTALGAAALRAAGTGPRSAEPNPVELALADLVHADPARRERAAASLLRTARRGGSDLEDLARRLGSAAGSGTAELALVRVTVAGARGGPVDARDLGDLAGLPGGPDLVAAVELVAGVKVDGPALDAARAVQAAHPAVAAVARLVGLLAWERADVALREEVARALAVPGAARGRAARVAVALHAADEVARAVDQGHGVDVAAPQLRVALAALEAPDRAAPAGVALAPVTLALRRALDRGDLTPVTGGNGPNFKVVTLEEAGVELPHRLAALLWLIRAHEDGGVDEARRPTAAALWRLGEDLAAQEGGEADPLLAAWVMSQSLEQALAARELTISAEVLLARGPRALAVLARAAPSSFIEKALAGKTAYRVEYESIDLRERLAQASEPTAARAHLEAALEHARRAFAVFDELRGSQPHRSARRRAVRLLALLGRLDEAEPLCEGIDEGPAVRAELRRRQGDPAAALTILETALEGESVAPEVFGAQALALADLGDLEAARRALASLEAANKRPLLAPFTPEAVRRALAR